VTGQIDQQQVAVAPIVVDPELAQFTVARLKRLLRKRFATAGECEAMG